MESKYNIENFERFLREKTDEFRIHPSKRVWNSIYNNMHPGNRLPSVSMSIVLIFSLLLVGYLNTDNNKQQNAELIKRSTSQVSATRFPVPLGQSSTLAKAPSLRQLQVRKNSNTVPNANTFVTTPNIITPHVNGGQALLSGNTNDYKQELVVENGVDKNTATALEPEQTYLQRANYDPTLIAYSNPLADNARQKVNLTNRTYLLITDRSALIQNDNGKAVNIDVLEKVQGLDKNLAKNNKDEAIATKTVKKANNNLSESDIAWIEDYAMYNRTAPKKWKGKVSWQAYITPSIVYRNLHNNAAGKYVSGYSANLNAYDVDDAIRQKPSFGLATGVGLQYDLMKALKLKAGVQLNYTRYNALGFENYHPIATSITMNSDNGSIFQLFATTPFTNSYGLSAVKLHNETYQVSLPFGADLRLAAVDNIEWYVGATLQPTYIAYANSYLISTDRRTYVKDRSLLNRFNVNTGLETYLSFKRSNYVLQVGPEFRKQLFSTNSKEYTIEERLLSYGLKIAIAKKL